LKRFERGCLKEERKEIKRQRILELSSKVEQMKQGMRFTIQFEGPVDLESIKKSFKKYFKFRVIKLMSLETSSCWTFRFDAERNEVIFGINDAVDKEEDGPKLEADMKHILKSIVTLQPNKVKRAIVTYEGEKNIVLR
jgi:hypothetical protein